MNVQLKLFITTIVFALSAFAGKVSVTPQELKAHVDQSIAKVDEFNFIKEQAQRMGIRVYLFGGTASSFLHYVKWDLERLKGDDRYLPTRFDFDFTNIFRSTQDLDIVIDGSIENVSQFQAMLVEKFPHFIGEKADWEVRSLRERIGTPDGGYYKEALLNDFDFLNQNSDSNSTGLIEITDPQDHERIKDLRNWNSKESVFLTDAANNKITYYRSKRHFETSRAKQGTNPEIFSAVRCLTKAFQNDLTISGEDVKQLQDVVNTFKPSDIAAGYARTRFIEMSKKLFKHAVDLEYAWNNLEKLGLRQKLMNFDNINSEESLAWWMNREPLRSKPLGIGDGPTAKELGIDLVSHETRSLLAYESITRSNLGYVNAFISRSTAPGETASYGDGFYTRMGRLGAAGTNLTVRSMLDPRARLKTDFIRAYNGTYIVVLNRNALRFVDEQINLTVADHFQQILTGTEFDKSNLGAIEKYKRRIRKGIKQEEISVVDEFIRNIHFDTAKDFTNGRLNKYLKTRLVEIIKEYLSLNKHSINRPLLKDLIQRYNLDIDWRIQFSVIVLPEFLSADHNRKKEIFWDLLKKLENPEKVMTSVLNGNISTLYEMNLAEIGNYFLKQDRLELVYFLLNKFDGQNSLGNLTFSKKQLPGLFLLYEKDSSKFPQFIEYCKRNALVLGSNDYFHLAIAPHFASYSESDKMIVMLQYYDQLIKEKTRFYDIEFKLIAEFLVGENKNSLLNVNGSHGLVSSWIAKHRFEIVQQLVQKLEPDSTFKSFVKTGPGSVLLTLMEIASKKIDSVDKVEISFLKQNFEPFKSLDFINFPGLQKHLNPKANGPILSNLVSLEFYAKSKQEDFGVLAKDFLTVLADHDTAQISEKSLKVLVPFFIQQIRADKKTNGIIAITSKLADLFLKTTNDKTKYAEFIAFSVDHNIPINKADRLQLYELPKFNTFSDTERLAILRDVIETENTLNHYSSKNKIPLLQTFLETGSLDQLFPNNSNYIDLKNWLKTTDKIDVVKYLLDNNAWPDYLESNPDSLMKLLIKEIRPIYNHYDLIKSFLNSKRADLFRINLAGSAFSKRYYQFATGRYQDKLQSRSFMFKSIIYNLMALDTNIPGFDMPYAEKVVQYMNFISLITFSEDRNKENLFVKFKSDISSSYRTNYNVQAYVSLQSMAQILLKNPDETARLFDMFVNSGSNSVKGGTFGYKNGKGFIKALKQVSMTEPKERAQPIENRRVSSELVNLSRFIFYSTVAINFMAKIVFPDVNYNEISAFINDVFYFHIGYLGLKALSVKAIDLFKEYIFYRKALKTEKVAVKARGISDLIAETLAVSRPLGCREIIEY